ncbi:F-box/FBD/LRR-repeat protein [Pyrus ussuriensis x Pyrus communis]|uniref:F-box/FBD/LRR-repeat protein n=1 Tax=Pyrus ussuriensis x Pyrus communis TaxID=2448454 RepID=A0A5N5GLL1_9ROSA|nr:F-box/FBD/LRR-repeat protein [Pyrus ussuriensis x Pyrus communis]
MPRGPAFSLRDSSPELKESVVFSTFVDRRNVVELDLRVDTILDDYRRFELPQCIFTSKTLVALKVSSNCITYDPPASGCFLKVKKFYLRTEYPDNDSMGKIFCST